MNAAATPARRLLAMLEEERSLETRPLDEILADLAAHGVDPAGPIKLARRLAGNHAGPAAALLGAVIEDEAVEAEIAALEAAPIDEVRGRLDVGTVAAVAAEAKRRGGAPSNVVGLRRRKSVAWAWAGSLVGMAACALIVVAAWWPPSELISPSPEFATVEVRPAPLADSTAPPVAAREAARPEIETSLSNQDGRALGRVAPSPDLAEGDMDAVGDDLETAPASPSPEESPEAPAIASRVAEPPDLSAGAAASSEVVGVAVPPAGPAPADPVVARERVEPPVPGVLNEDAAPPLPPSPPEERRDLADGIASGASAGSGMPAEPAPQDWIGRLQSPDVGYDRTMPGLRVEIAPPASTPRPRGLPFFVTDGVVFPQSFGWGSDETWTDGAFPFLAHVQAEGAQTPLIGLVPDPLPVDADTGEPLMPESFRPMPLSVGTISGALASDVASRQERRRELVSLTRGLLAILRDAQSVGADPWTGRVADRLADARLLAGGGTIIALMTIRSADSEFDAMLVPRAAGTRQAPDDPMVPLLSRWFGDNAPDYRLITLPAR